MRRFVLIGFAAAGMVVIACGLTSGQANSASAQTAGKAAQTAAGNGRHSNRTRLLKEYAHAKAGETEATAESKRDRLKKQAQRNGLAGTGGARQDALTAKAFGKYLPGTAM